MKKTAITSIALCLFSFNSYALDSSQSDALKMTQEVLRDSSKRMDAVNSSTDGQAAHQKILSMFGASGNVDKAYEMAAQMMGAVTKEAGGDATKMQEILKQGLANPASLAERMPSEFKKMLGEAAKDFESMGEAKQP